MSEVKQIESMDDWTALHERSKEHPVFLLKHSTTCPISAAAHDQFLRAVQSHADEGIEFARVYVIESRPTSLAIADELQIRHASPQLLFLKDGKVAWVESHHAITVDAIDTVLTRYAHSES